MVVLAEQGQAPLTNAEGGRTQLSVVVPVYNSQATLRTLVERLGPVLSAVASDYELILVNDGSRDASWNVIEELSVLHPWIRGINLTRNYGQHGALLCGIRTAAYPLIVTMDDDLQNPPEEIPKLLRALTGSLDVVYGMPRVEQHNLARNLASRITKLAMSSAMGAEAARNTSTFRVIRAHVRRAFENYTGPFVSIDVLLTWGTTRFAAIPVEHEPRGAGASNYTFRKLIVHALNMMTGFSTLPLHLVTLMGFAVTLFGMGVFVYVVVGYLRHGSVPGFSFLAVIISIFSGAQLCALGIIGEYLARIHFRSMGRPSSTVREEVGASARKDAMSIP
jgi:glycosyltransferase involved in cell wall biosynthesis